MQHLTGINIRSGLELEVPLGDILSLNKESIGDIRAKFFFENEKNGNKQDVDLLKCLKAEGLLQYKEFIVEKDLNSSLKVAIYNEYSITYNIFSKKRYHSNVSTELVFYNTEQLSFEDFCFNLMTAQAFSGNFPQLNFQHYFIGIGSFKMDAAASVFPLAVAGNLSLSFFFLFDKGILSTVENIITGTIDDDLEAQKDYLDPKEYKLIKNNLKKYKKEVEKLLNDKI